MHRTLKKCMSIAKSLTNTQHMELEPLCSAERKIERHLLLPNSNKLTRPVLVHRPECTSRIHPLPNSLGANVCSVNFAIKNNPGKCDECKDGYYGKITN